MEEDKNIITQNWLKSTYGSNCLFTINVTQRDNIIKGLIQALQIELGVTADGNWNNDTTNAFEQLFPNGLSVETLVDENRTIKNIICILKAGFYIARGISAGEMNEYFGEDLTTAIKTFQAQAGLTPDGIVRAYLLKGILTTNSYELDKEGDSQIRTIQQNLNYKYHDYIELIPTNGIYGTETNRALRKAIEIELNSIENNL